MAAMKPSPVWIGNRLWRDVTNETCTGDVYLLSDVLRAGGEIPKIITIRNDPSPLSKKPNREERRKRGTHDR